MSRFWGPIGSVPSREDSYTADLVSLRREWQARGLPDPTVEDYAFNRNFRLTVVGRGKPKQSIAMLEQ